eukprot:s101_g9.t1
MDLRFVWQVWHLATSTVTLCGRRGTYGSGLGPVTHLFAAGAASVCVAGVALGVMDLRFVWQGWHLATSTVTLRGRRGTYGSGLGLVTRLVAAGAASFCVAGVALGVMALHIVWQAALGNIDCHFVWQAWHLRQWAVSGDALGCRGRRIILRGRVSWTFVLCGRRGTWQHRFSLCVAGVALTAVGWVCNWCHEPSFCVAGVALGNIDCHFVWSFCVAGVALGVMDLRFVWQAWHLATSTVTLCGRCGTWSTSTVTLCGRRGTYGSGLGRDVLGCHGRGIILRRRRGTGLVRRAGCKRYFAIFTDSRECNSLPSPGLVSSSLSSLTSDTSGAFEDPIEELPATGIYDRLWLSGLIPNARETQCISVTFFRLGVGNFAAEKNVSYSEPEMDLFCWPLINVQMVHQDSGHTFRHLDRCRCHGQPVDSMAPYVLRRKNVVVVAFVAGLVAGCGTASVTRVTSIKDLRDPRIALYRPKHLRRMEEYHSAMLQVLVASKAHLHGGEACEGLRARPRMLRRRANAVKGLPCAVSVHHGFECLKCALQAAHDSRIFVESILLPAATAHTLPVDLPQWTKVYGIEDPGLLKRLFRSDASNASADTCRYGCRYTVAWPSVALEELTPPLLVLDGLTSATNLGQSLDSLKDVIQSYMFDLFLEMCVDVYILEIFDDIC